MGTYGSDHDSIGVDITLGRLPGIRIVQKFGAFVGCRSPGVHSLGELNGGEKAGESKVTDLRVQIARNKDIIGLEVTVNDIILVKELQSLSDFQKLKSIGQIRIK